MEVVRGEVRVELIDIGEGRNGDYDEDDLDDYPHLRFYVSCWSYEHGGWEDVDDASYCTTIPANTSENDQEQVCEAIMDEVYEAVRSGASIKKLCERLSWITVSDVRDTGGLKPWN